jgi:hypothetical protein
MHLTAYWMDRLGRVERTQRILGMVLLSLFAALPAAAVEQRCEELRLGTSCTCSETYDTTSHTDNIGGAGNANADNSSAAEECNDHTGSFFPAVALTTPAETGMPAGNDVDFVWRVNKECTPAVSSGKRIKADTRRVCVRSYQRVSPDYYNNGTNGGKWIELTFDGAHSLQYGHNGYGTGQVLSCRKFWDASQANCIKSGTLTPNDLLGEWVRVEMCAEGNFPGSSGEFFMEGYWERVRDGKRMDVPYQSVGSATSPVGKGVNIWPANMFRGCEGAPYGCAGSLGTGCSFSGHREVSHTMQAEWPFQRQGLFIGEAYEIEGGTPGAPAPPPPPSQSPSQEPLGKPGQPQLTP